ncbi:uncharacterized protein H6S33_003875 [Morchella sextelata]|uniref:uncharacterized protein n=1 Tax=Morchella sextelata TaxID=1174677 RepID=UPI001D04E5B5|nr:uncharacterized protein H6S33_003875 [Morchella sextelata]KAH0606214.1 hypothetical protein H6S33_003875 [Morchella sextelata]
MSQPTTFTPPQSTHWPSSNFVLAAGTATFQPSTRKVLIIQDTSRTRPGTPRESCLWFLPRGRKDIGESIEDCAVRETLEEAGYTATFLSTPHATLQPTGSNSSIGPHTEAIHLQVMPHTLRRPVRLPEKLGDLCLYVAFWFLCTIPADAVRVPDYGAHFVGAHERGYDSELVEVGEAVKLLSGGRLEYREEGERGCVVERRTGRRVRWEDVEAEWAGGVEALVVARGWEALKKAVEDGWMDVAEDAGGS